MLRKEASNTLRLAFPIIIGELAQMALHIIDTAMVGAISYKQLAAASLVINALNIPFVIGIGMTISVSQMVSMAHGRRDSQLVSHYFFNGFILCCDPASNDYCQHHENEKINRAFQHWFFLLI